MWGPIQLLQIYSQYTGNNTLTSTYIEGMMKTRPSIIFKKIIRSYNHTIHIHTMSASRTGIHVRRNHIPTIRSWWKCCHGTRSLIKCREMTRWDEVIGWSWYDGGQILNLFIVLLFNWIIRLIVWFNLGLETPDDLGRSIPCGGIHDNSLRWFVWIFASVIIIVCCPEFWWIFLSLLDMFCCWASLVILVRAPKVVSAFQLSKET